MLLSRSVSRRLQLPQLVFDDGKMSLQDFFAFSCANRSVAFDSF